MRNMYDHGRYQCLLLESEDMDDSVGAELAFGGHFLDFPYDISAGTKNSVEDILRAKIDAADEAHFVLWDKEQLEVVGRAKIENLDLEKEDRPEISQSYIKMDRRGEGLIDWLYEGRLRFLSEEGFEHVKCKIEKINTASFKAAIRNGFSLYDPPSAHKSGDQSADHLTRRVPLADIRPTPDYTHNPAEQEL